MTVPISYFFGATPTYKQSCRKCECQKSTKYVIDALISIPFLILGILGATGVLPVGFSAAFAVPAVMALLYVGYVAKHRYDKSQKESVLEVRVAGHEVRVKSPVVSRIAQLDRAIDTMEKDMFEGLY